MYNFSFIDSGSNPGVVSISGGGSSSCAWTDIAWVVIPAILCLHVPLSFSDDAAEEVFVNIQLRFCKVLASSHVLLMQIFAPDV